MIKKLFCIIMTVAICFSLVGCGLYSSDDNPTLDVHEEAVFDDDEEDTSKAMSDEDSFLFTWMTYSEIRVTDALAEKTAYEKHIKGLFNNMKKIGVTDCFVQVRPFADAMYKSEYYPLSVYAEKAKDFDPFAVIVSLGKSHGVNIHAWINPYRISSSKLTSSNPYYEMSNSDAEYIVTTASGVYFNPCSLKAQTLILSGVEELMENYSIKGIHIDDYFYPADFGDKDTVQYESYCKKGGDKDIASWRRENVNSLIAAIYLKVRSFGEDKIFSVSPSGNIKKNYSQLYVDVYEWCKGGYCDIILPQIYFGFENESLPFGRCFEEWLNITDRDKVRLIPALALYKAGKEDVFAGDGKYEWKDKGDIISRQVKLMKESNCKDFALYSSSYINFSEKFTAQELKNLQSVI